MNNHIQPATNYLADQWLSFVNNATHGATLEHAQRIMKTSFEQMGGRAIGPIVDKGEKKGVRYLFADTSYCDFYFEVKEKGAVFTGIRGDLDASDPITVQ